MDRPPPCDDAEPGGTRPSGAQTAEAGSSRALRHYDCAIEALAGVTYDGLSAAERRALLASLCREKQRLVRAGTDAP